MSLYWPRAHHARAKEHIVDVRQVISDYVDDLQGKSGGTVRHWQPRITLGAREAVDNLRWALDSLVVELARLDSGEEHDHEGVRFPIESQPEDFESRRETLLRGVSAEHFDELAEFQPFNHVMWTWHLLVLSEPLTRFECITGVSGGSSGLPDGTDIRRIGSATYTFTAFLGDETQGDHVEVPLEDALLLADEGVGEVIGRFESEFER